MMRPAFAGRTSFCFLKTCFCLCSMWVFILPAGFVRLYTFFLISVGSFLVEETNQRPQKGGLRSPLFYLSQNLLLFALYAGFYLTRRLSAFLYLSSKKTLFISCGRNEPKTTKERGRSPFFYLSKNLFLFVLYVGFYLTRRVCTFIYIFSNKRWFISYGRNEPKTPAPQKIKFALWRSFII